VVAMACMGGPSPTPHSLRLGTSSLDLGVVQLRRLLRMRLGGLGLGPGSSSSSSTWPFYSTLLFACCSRNGNISLAIYHARPLSQWHAGVVG
jgi:hypothetical protein